MIALRKLWSEPGHGLESLKWLFNNRPNQIKTRPIRWAQVSLQELPEWRNISRLPIGSPYKDWFTRLFGLAVSVWPIRAGRFGLSRFGLNYFGLKRFCLGRIGHGTVYILVWPFQCGEISVTKFLYINNWLLSFIEMIIYADEISR